MSVTASNAEPVGAEPSGRDAPSVSILVCTRNRADQLAGTLKSLSAIRSSIAWEAVILDNASTDATKEVIAAACAADPRLRYAYEAQPGLGAARDSGWRLARGEVVALSDDDCYFTPDFIESVWSVFSENPEVGVVGGRILLFDPADAPLTIDLRTQAERTEPRSVVRTGAFHGANLSFRRAALDKVGGFNRQLGAGTPFPAEDIDAVAAVIWTGYAGLFDPRPTIHHHHRRRAADVAPQMKRFDAGRGAYYAKYAMRSDTRSAYLADWAQRRGALHRLKNPRQTANEMASALRYLFRFGSGEEKAALAPLFASVFVCAALQRAAGAVRRRASPAKPPMPQTRPRVGG